MFAAIRTTSGLRGAWAIASTSAAIPKPVGRVCSLAEVQRAIDGVETSADLNVSDDEVRKAGQRVRKVIAKLRKPLREGGAEDYLKIVRGGDAENPDYTMVFNIAQNRCETPPARGNRRCC